MHQIVCFGIFWDSWVLRDPTFPANKKTDVKGSATCAEVEGLISQKRRGHFDFGAEKCEHHGFAS